MTLSADPAPDRSRCCSSGSSSRWRSRRCVPGGATTGSGAVESDAHTPRVRRSSRPSRARTPSAPSPGCSPRSSRRCSSSWSAVYDFLETLGVPAAIGWRSSCSRSSCGHRSSRSTASSWSRSGGCSCSSRRSRRSRSATRATPSRSALAQQELFKERGINPLAGCLPAPAPAAAAVHHVLGHLAGPDQRGPDARC